MILILRQFLVDCQPATGGVRGDGFVNVAFGFGHGPQAHSFLCREREAWPPSAITFCVPAFGPQLSRPFTTGCALLGQPRHKCEISPPTAICGEEVRDVVSPTLRAISTVTFAHPAEWDTIPARGDAPHIALDESSNRYRSRIELELELELGSLLRYPRQPAQGTLGGSQPASGWRVR
jgi:hypothetical protein